MSDDELANFFAKKDRFKRKNKKNKPISVTQQLQVENENETVEDEVKKIKKKTNKSELESMEQILGINDNDWQEHNTDDIDYSTLRLQSLVVNETPVNLQDYDADQNSDDNVDKGNDQYMNITFERQKESGPWKENHYVPVKINLEPEPEITKVAEATSTSAPKRYVPPSMRMGGGVGGGGSGMPSNMTSSAMRRRGNNMKPNMNSEADFPSLAPGIVIGANGTRVGTFTKVKDGAKNDFMQEAAQKVSTENKFKALSN